MDEIWHLQWACQAVLSLQVDQDILVVLFDRKLQADHDHHPHLDHPASTYSIEYNEEDNDRTVFKKQHKSHITEKTT